MQFEVHYTTCLQITVSVKHGTNQLPSVSFTVTAGTAKSLKITSDSRSNFYLVFFSRAQRRTQKLCSGLPCGIAQSHTYGLPSNNAASRAEKS